MALFGESLVSTRFNRRPSFPPSASKFDPLRTRLLLFGPFNYFAGPYFRLFMAAKRRMATNNSFHFPIVLFSSSETGGPHISLLLAWLRVTARGKLSFFLFLLHGGVPPVFLSFAPSLSISLSFGARRSLAHAMSLAGVFFGLLSRAAGFPGSFLDSSIFLSLVVVFFLFFQLE